VGRLCELFHNIVKSPVFLTFSRSDRAPSDASGAAEADRHLIAVDDHGDGAAAAAVRQHALERRRVLLDVEVLERNVPPLKILPGGLRVRSGVFAEDVDHG
jgi:hypothetical protein